MTVVRLALALALLLASACGPRIGVRREVPARIDLGRDSVVLAVTNTHEESVLSVVLNPFAALVRTLLTPEAMRRLEQDLSRSSLYRVIPRCGDFCPAADTLVEVSVTDVRVDPGNATKSIAKEAHATVNLRVLKRGGGLAYAGSYSRSRSGGVPGTKNELTDDSILTTAVHEAVDEFYQDLHPQMVEESFKLEAEKEMEPCAKAAQAGDLTGAEALCREVLATQPENAKAIYMLGVIFTSKGQLVEALDAFRAAAARDPKYKYYLDAAQRRITDRQRLQSEGR